MVKNKKMLGKKYMHILGFKVKATTFFIVASLLLILLIFMVRSCQMSTDDEGDSSIPGGLDENNLCEDTDGGKVVGVKGECVDYVGHFYTDSCVASNILRDYYCDTDGKCKLFDTNCPEGFTCLDGRCQK